MKSSTLLSLCLRPLRVTAVAMLLVPWGAPAAWANGFPWKDGLVVTQGDSVVSLAKDGRTQWQATFSASGSLEIVPDSKAPWLVCGDRLWAFDPTQGRSLWTFDLDGPIVMPPQPVSDPVWVLSWKSKEQWAVATLAKDDGRKLWSRSFSVKPAVVSDDGQTPLVIEAGDELLALSPDGSLRWSVNQPHEKCYFSKDRLVILNPGEILCLDRDSGERLWRQPIPKTEPTPENIMGIPPPPGVQVALGPGGASPELVVVQVQDHLQHVVLCFQLSTGKILWRKQDFPNLFPHVSWSGPHLIHRLLESTETLKGQDGVPELFIKVNLQSLQSYFWQNHVMIVARGSYPQVALDPKGRPILDLTTGKPRVEQLDSFNIYLDGLLWANCTGNSVRIALLGDTLVYDTRNVAPRLPGQSLAEAEPPLRLHGAPSPQAKPWEWTPSNTRDRLKKWSVSDGHLLLFHNDGHLSELNPATGETLWRSAPLWSDGMPDVTPEPSGGFWVQTDTAQVYFLDSNGKVSAHRDLRLGYDYKKSTHLACLLMLAGAICYYIGIARGRKLFIRRIAGLEAIDEAVGRATEMGRPVLYVPGLEDIDVIQTLASLSILGHVARKTADYETDIIVPTRKAVVMSTAQEVVREAYTAAGRPDSFIADNVRYLTDDQFGFVAGVDGIMLREKPAANFYLGMFYGEALILAETGFATGAIQIAGTAAPSQLPFFVATCDYTLMGEELYAASAYLSQDPLQVGSLRGQDVGKALVMAALAVGTIHSTLAGLSL